jgi:hypothetical protein
MQADEQKRIKKTGRQRSAATTELELAGQPPDQARCRK